MATPAMEAACAPAAKVGAAPQPSASPSASSMRLRAVSMRPSLRIVAFCHGWCVGSPLAHYRPGRAFAATSTYNAPLRPPLHITWDTRYNVGYTPRVTLCAPDHD